MADPLPDRLPNPPPAPFFWGGNTWSWFATVLQTIYRAARAQSQPPAQDARILTALASITSTLENMTMTMSDLGASQDRSEASTTAALAGISTEIQQVRDAVAALGSSPTPDELAAFKARVDANTDRIDAAVALLTSDDPAAPPVEPTP